MSNFVPNFQKCLSNQYSFIDTFNKKLRKHKHFNLGNG